MGLGIKKEERKLLKQNGKSTCKGKMEVYSIVLEWKEAHYDLRVECRFRLRLKV